LLKGFNLEWLVANEQTPKAPFTNLDPGRYTFRVRAASGSSREGGERLASALWCCRLSFWKTKTALFLYISAIISAILGALLPARRITLVESREG